MKFRVVFATILLILSSSLQVFAADQVYYYHTDPAGTPLSMTDSNGTVVWKADYKPFGEEYAVTGSAANDKRFVGKEKDEETGLSYFGARYEDAKIGRFTAVDPVSAVDPITGKTNEKVLLNPQRLNAYAYTLNNPYRFVDPDGRDVAFTVDPLAAGGNGHTSLFYQDRNGGWNKYDQGAAGETRSSGGNKGFLLGFDAPAGVSIKPVGSLPGEAFVIKTSRNQDALIADSALKSQAEHNSGAARYNLYSNNCTDAATDVVNKSDAGIKIPNPWHTIKPNSWFKTLINTK
ncbi:MAG TPA: hypothetical protein DER40_11850 [Geobacter sp.]|nr:hypothetical protein [Geobacter sp.]